MLVSVSLLLALLSPFLQGADVPPVKEGLLNREDLEIDSVARDDTLTTVAHTQTTGETSSNDHSTEPLFTMTTTTGGPGGEASTQAEYTQTTESFNLSQTTSREIFNEEDEGAMNFVHSHRSGSRSHQVSQSDVDRLIDQLYSKSEPYIVGHGWIVNHYYISKLYMNAASAQRACGVLGGYLAEVNSQREYDFVRQFATPHMLDHVPVTISGYSVYRHSIPENFRLSYNVNITGEIDDVIIHGRPDSSDEGGMTSRQYPLFTDFFPDRPSRAESPSCLGLSHRSWQSRGDTVRMTNEKCRATFRYLCEVPSM